MNKLFSTLLLCMMCIMANATVYTWTGAAGTSNWKTAGNWNVGNTVATTYPQTASDDVIIPAGRTIYPVLSEATTIHDIFFEVRYMDRIAEVDLPETETEIKTTTSARLKNQHLLTYNKAYCDVTIRANRWVRITAPLKNTVAGDYFAKHQTLDTRAWGGYTYDEDSNRVDAPANYHFTDAMYKAVDGNKYKEGSDGNATVVNRSIRSTYASYYSTMQVVHHAYNGVDSINRFDSQWGDPSNPLGYEITPAMGFDVWIDRGSKHKNDEVTFHFPSGNDSYSYYQQNGYISTTRDDEQVNHTTSPDHGKMALDRDDMKDGKADYELSRDGVGKHSNMWAIGNPAFAYLDIARFIHVNVDKGHIYRYVYTHNEEYASRGTENIYFYNRRGDDKLYVLNAAVSPLDSAAMGNTDPKGESAAKQEVTNDNRQAYINPAEGFRVIGGGVSYKCDVPELVGVYTTSQVTVASRVTEKYYSGQTLKTDTAKYSDYEIQMLKDGYVDFIYSINVVAGNPHQVRINNFLNLGSVVATIDRDAQTLTIPAGTPMVSLVQGTTSDAADNDYWAYSDKSGTKPGDVISDMKIGTANNAPQATVRVLKVYGKTDDVDWMFDEKKHQVYSADNKVVLADNITNTNTCDITLRYTIDDESGAVSLYMDPTIKIFLRSDAVSSTIEETNKDNISVPAYHHASDVYISGRLCEAWFAYDNFTSSKEGVSNDGFIMKDMMMEGTYQTNARSVYGSYGGKTNNSTYGDIQIARIYGRDDVVSITGLFPGDNTTPVLAQIMRCRTKNFAFSSFTGTGNNLQSMDSPITVRLTNATRKTGYVALSSGATINVSSTGPKIKKIVLTGYSEQFLFIFTSHFVGNWSGTWSATTDDRVWDGTAQNVTLDFTGSTSLRTSEARLTNIEVTYEDSESGEYRLVIPAGQLAHISGETPAPEKDYYFYSHGNASERMNTVEMIWHPSDDGRGSWETVSHSDNKSCFETMVSRQGLQPDGNVRGNVGAILGRKPAGTNICFLDRIGDQYDEDKGWGAAEDFSENAPSTNSFIELTFTPDMFQANIPAVATSAPKRAPAANVNAPVIISAVSDSLQASTMIVLDANASDDFRPSEDAALFDVESYAFAFGTLAGSHLVGVNSIAYEELIPLFISKSATLRFSNIATLGNAYLYDAVADTRVLINDTCAYTLEILEGQQAGRYFIETNIEAPAIETDIEDVQAEGFSWKPVAYCPASGSLSVACADETVRFEVYDLNGQLVGSSDGPHTFNNMRTGAYIVNAIRGGEQQGLKVIVY